MAVLGNKISSLYSMQMHADPNFIHLHRKLAALIPFDSSFPCVHRTGGLEGGKTDGKTEKKEALIRYGPVKTSM